VTLYQIAEAATKSLTTDPALGSVQALLSLAETMRALKLKDITFVTLPNELDPANIDRLIPMQPAASEVFQLLRADLPWNGRLTSVPVKAPEGKAAAGKASTGKGKRRAAVASSSSASSDSASQVQTRNASENLCSGLPTPNNLGDLGG
jgi:hypothetical protein